MGQPECVRAINSLLDLHTYIVSDAGVEYYAQVAAEHGLDLEMGQISYGMLVWMLKNAKPFHVADNVVGTLVSPGLSDWMETRLSPDDLPADHGYLYFNGPIGLSEGSNLSLYAVAWMVDDLGESGGYFIQAFTARMVNGRPEKSVVLPIISIPFRGINDEATIVANPEVLTDEQQLTLTLAWAIHTRACIFMRDRFQVTSERRNLGSLARMRYKRYHKEEPAVQVITLRAIDYIQRGDNEPQHVDWQFRWKVRKHWRTLKDGRRIEVKQHEKGPKDKPLREYQATVFDVSR